MLLHCVYLAVIISYTMTAACYKLHRPGQRRQVETAGGAAAVVVAGHMMAAAAADKTFQTGSCHLNLVWF